MRGMLSQDCALLVHGLFSYLPSGKFVAIGQFNARRESALTITVVHAIALVDLLTALPAVAPMVYTCRVSSPEAFWFRNFWNRGRCEEGE